MIPKHFVFATFHKSNPMGSEDPRNHEEIIGFFYKDDTMPELFGFEPNQTVWLLLSADKTPLFTAELPVDSEGCVNVSAFLRTERLGNDT